MTTLREAAQRAVEEWFRPRVLNYVYFRPYMEALRTALQTPPPPPEAQTDGEKNAYAFGWWAAMQAVREQRTESVQEPVAWVCYGFGGEGKHSIDFYQAEIDEIPIGTLLYTTPPAAQRKPLTDEEIRDLWKIATIKPCYTSELIQTFTRAIERAHGIGGEA
jgi:hypothetical protein